jgi:chromosomal replication initiator protein
MHLCRELLDLPLAEIGRAFGGRDHSTVIHSLAKVDEERKRSAAFRGRVDTLRRSLAELRDGASP